MKFLNAPRQPFVGLSLAAAIGITIADVFPPSWRRLSLGDDHFSDLHSHRRV